MQGQSTQIKITIPVQLQEYVQSKASKFGLSLSAYIKNLIIEDVKDMELPVYQASAAVEAAYREAKAAEARGELIEVRDLDTFFKNL